MIAGNSALDLAPHAWKTHRQSHRRDEPRFRPDAGERREAGGEEEEHRGDTNGSRRRLCCSSCASLAPPPQATRRLPRRGHIEMLQRAGGCGLACVCQGGNERARERASIGRTKATRCFFPMATKKGDAFGGERLSLSAERLSLCNARVGRIAREDGERRTSLESEAQPRRSQRERREKTKGSEREEKGDLVSFLSPQDPVTRFPGMFYYIKRQPRPLLRDPACRSGLPPGVIGMNVPLDGDAGSLGALVAPHPGSSSR